MARKKRADEGPPGSPAWMATYGDMMSLLLTFFILLVSFSSIQESKFHEAVGSLQGALGVLKSMPTLPMHEEVIIPSGTQRSKENILERVQELKKQIEEMKRSEEIDVSYQDKGMAIRLKDRALFDLGKAEIRTEAYPILDEVAKTLQGYPNPVRIEGHTDNLPLRNGRFPTNWELSAARASSILRYLQGKGIDPRRLSATGYGEWRPMVRNDSAEGRQKNRRVEIFMDIVAESRPSRLGE